MRILVTGSAGHLGEALVRVLREGPHDVRGLDLLASPFTDHVGSVGDREFVASCLGGIDVVIHTATLHKPHIATHPRSAFVQTNVAGTLAVLEAARATGVTGVVMSSTTSVFGGALRPPRETPAVWVTEDLASIPRNIYGVTKEAAEALCELFFRTEGLPCVVLRTSRFFPEGDDDPDARRDYEDLNLKVNEFLFRRVDLEDAAVGHILAAERVAEIGFARYILSATTPFEPSHCALLHADAPRVVHALFPDYEEVFRPRGWRMFPRIGRVYVNARARRELGWTPSFDFRHALERLRAGEEVLSPLARAVGRKGYHRDGAGSPG